MISRFAALWPRESWVCKCSGLPSCIKGNVPDWLVVEPVLRSLEPAQDGRGGRAYVAWLEARTGNAGGKIDRKAMAAIRRGWHPPSINRQ